MKTESQCGTFFTGIFFGELICGTYQIIGQATEGWSKPKIVKVSVRGKEQIGYMKRTSTMGIKNEIEFVLFQIGNTLDVPIAKTICVLDENSGSKISAIISLSVAACPYERFICFREMRDELFFDLQNGAIPRSSWINRWREIRARRNTLSPDRWDVPALSDSDYYDSFMFAQEIISLYSTKHSIMARSFTNEYVTMLLFDILCGQADRSPSNYGIVLDCATHKAHMAPLFDNSSLEKPFVNLKQFSINQVILDRKRAAQVVYEIWPAEAQAILAVFFSKQERVFTHIQTSKLLTHQTAEILLKSIKEGYSSLDSIKYHE